MKAPSPVDRPIVVKVGGSLLDWPELPSRLRELRDSLPDRAPIFIAGGGRIVDALRELDRIHGMGEPRSHALAIRALDVTASFLASILEDSELVESETRLAEVRDRGLCPIVIPTAFFSESAAPEVPRSWSLTSDSLAAYLAVRLEAIELRLLKSVAASPWSCVWDISRKRIVDPFFPRFATGIPRLVLQNLRDPSDPGSVLIDSHSRPKARSGSALPH